MLDALYIIYTTHICIILSQDRIGILMLDALYIVLPNIRIHTCKITEAFWIHIRHVCDAMIPTNANSPLGNLRYQYVKCPNGSRGKMLSTGEYRDYSFLNRLLK